MASAAVVPALVAALAGPQDPALEILTRTSTRLEARHWHRAVELTAHATADSADPSLLVRAALANLAAGRANRARSLLDLHPAIGGEGDALFLAVLGEVELALGRADSAAVHLAAARAAGSPASRGRLAVREALAWEAAANLEAAAAAYRVARRALPEIDGWLRIRQAGVTMDTARALQLLGRVSPPARGHALRARVTVRLRAGDSLGALREAVAAPDRIAAGRLALALGDTGLARTELYRGLADRGPGHDDLVATIQRAVPPARAAEHAALAEALRRTGRATRALPHARAAVALRDSTPDDLVLLGEVLWAMRRFGEAARAFRGAELRGAGAQAALRHAQALRRGRAANALEALESVAQRYPGSPQGAAALFSASEAARDRGQIAEASRLLTRVLERYPDARAASSARMQLARTAMRAGARAEAQRWLAREVAARGSEQIEARYWRAKLLEEAGDTGAARREWRAVAERDPVGYYGVRARERAGLPPPRFGESIPEIVPAEVERFRRRLDVLREIGLDDEERAEVDWLLRRPPEDADDVLAYGEVLIARAYVAQGIRLAWLASRELGLMDPRVLRSVFPWPRRAVIEAEAREFGLEPALLAALVRQESSFDSSATSRSGARGLAQLMPSTAAWLARRLDIQWDPSWITVADLNLHLGAAHLAGLLRSYDGDLVLALAAYNAGGGRVRRWLRSEDPGDPDRWIEHIPFSETRHYVRAVLRNLAVYRALYAP